MADLDDLTKRNVTLRTLYDRNAGYDLSAHTVLDGDGVPDALRNRAFDAIAAIRTHILHPVLQDEEGSPDLLAYGYYGSERLYWVIMAYNGLANFAEMVAGTVLKIPDPAQVHTTLSSLLSSRLSTQLNSSKVIEF